MKFKNLLVIVGLLLIGGLFSHIHNQHTAVEGIQTKAFVSTQLPTDTPIPTSTPILPTITPTLTVCVKSQQSTNSTKGSDGLSNDSYYTNSDGSKVHAPAYSTNENAPEGATAQCTDGTYSFSQHRNGTCSDHGGVAIWY